MWRKSSAGRTVEVMAAIGLGDFARERERDQLSRRLLSSKLETFPYMDLFVSRGKERESAQS